MYGLNTHNTYRYGFQGQERDDEVKGAGNSYNYTFRMHDPRFGRFFAVDPLIKKYPHYTPYSFAGNKVIYAKELEGLEEFIVIREYYDGEFQKETILRLPTYNGGNPRSRAHQNGALLLELDQEDPQDRELIYDLLNDYPDIRELSGGINNVKFRDRLIDENGDFVTGMYYSKGIEGEEYKKIFNSIRETYLNDERNVRTRSVEKREFMINYLNNEWKLSEQDKGLLDNMAYYLNSSSEHVVLTIEGHTSMRGTDESNEKLSKKRAKTITEYLVSKGVDQSRIEFVYKGESEPLDDSDSEDADVNSEAAIRNRRSVDRTNIPKGTKL